MRNEATAHNHRESEDGVHVLDESALYFAPPRRVQIYPARPPVGTRHPRGRAEAGPYGPFQQLFHTPLVRETIDDHQSSLLY